MLFFDNHFKQIFPPFFKYFRCSRNSNLYTCYVNLVLFYTIVIYNRTLLLSQFLIFRFLRMYFQFSFGFVNFYHLSSYFLTPLPPLFFSLFCSFELISLKQRRSIYVHKHFFCNSFNNDHNYSSFQLILCKVFG